MFPVGVYNVEDYPLNWISGTYYSTYKGNTFQVSLIENVKSEAEYDAVTNIDLNTQSLTTDFTNTLLSKFNNLNILRCNNNSISVLDVSNLTGLITLNCYDNSISILDVSNLTGLTNLFCHTNSISILDVSNLTSLSILTCQSNSISVLDVSNLTSLVQLYCHQNSISVLDVSNLVNLTDLRCHLNSISVLDVSNLVNLNQLRCHNNQIDAATNSQILIDLDANGLSNGYLQSSIFGGGTLTAAGQTAKTNLLSKGWSIVGI